MILVDTSALLAAWDIDDERHAAARDALVVSHPPRLLSPFVLAGAPLGIAHL